VIIAVDGPSAAGKGTLARGIAKHFGFHYLDTGALYRMVGLAVLRAGTELSDEEIAAQLAKNLNPAEFNDGDLRTETVARAASKVAALPKVRANLLAFQQNFAKKQPGAVLDGRDIGTVICPNADYKFYITASVAARTERRFKELIGLGHTVSLAEVTADIESRDLRDAAQSAPAADAIIIDTSKLSVAACLETAIKLIASNQ
jgi:cytidylate kinase